MRELGLGLVKEGSVEAMLRGRSSAPWAPLFEAARAALLRGVSPPESASADCGSPATCAEARDASEP
jgi:hypothetical protein